LSCFYGGRFRPPDQDLRSLPPSDVITVVPVSSHFCFTVPPDDHNFENMLDFTSREFDPTEGEPPMDVLRVKEIAQGVLQIGDLPLTLLLNGVELDDEIPLWQLKNPEGNPIVMVGLSELAEPPRPRPNSGLLRTKTIKLMMSGPDEPAQPREFPATAMVQDVKRVIAGERGVAEEDVCLVYSGKSLGPRLRLRQLWMDPGSKITIYLQDEGALLFRSAACFTEPVETPRRFHFASLAKDGRDLDLELGSLAQVAFAKVMIASSLGLGNAEEIQIVNDQGRLDDIVQLSDLQLAEGQSLGYQVADPDVATYDALIKKGAGASGKLDATEEFQRAEVGARILRKVPRVLRRHLTRGAIGISTVDAAADFLVRSPSVPLPEDSE
jgi:hypothetical protein